MKVTVGDTLRTLNALERVYVETRSVEIVRLVLMCVALALEDCVDSGVDVYELALALATGGLAVTAAALFDTSDPALQQLSARYREYSRTDCASVPKAEGDATSQSAWRRRV